MVFYFCIIMVDLHRKIDIKKKCLGVIFWFSRLKLFCWQICLKIQVNEIHVLYDKHHKVSSFLKSHQNIDNSVKYEVI